MKIVIPMAGRGTRMRPQTNTTPKPLLPIAGKSIVQRLIEELSKSVEEKIDEIANQLGLNAAEFNQQQNNPDFVAQIRQDYEEGIRLGIRGVPTVFINGQKMRDRSMEGLEDAINKELEKAKGAQK